MWHESFWNNPVNVEKYILGKRKQINNNTNLTKGLFE